MVEMPNEHDSIPEEYQSNHGDEINNQVAHPVPDDNLNNLFTTANDEQSASSDHSTVSDDENNPIEEVIDDYFEESFEVNHGTDSESFKNKLGELVDREYDELVRTYCENCE